MNVLLIAYACEPNKGSEPGVGWNWAVHLSKYVTVTVVTRANNKAPIEGELREKSYQNLSFIYYDLPLFAKIKKIFPFGVQIYYSTWQYMVTKILRDEINNNYDLVHHVTFNSITLPFFIYKLKIRKIIGPLGGGQITALKFLTSYRYKMLPELLRTFFVKLNTYNYILRNNLENADRLYCINDETAKLIPQQFLTKTNKLLETAITDIFFRNNSPIPPKSKNELKQLLWIGDLEPHKGLILLLKALPFIRGEFKLKIIGTGSFSNYYQKFVKRKLLQKTIEFLGRVHYKDIVKFYQESDIFLFTSVRDSSGNVVLEAMSQGLPIICLDHQGVKEIVDERCGIKINPKEKNIPKKLADAIQLLIDEDELRLLLGSNAKKNVLEKYTWDSKILKVYSEFINENPSGT